MNRNINITADEQEAIERFLLKQSDEEEIGNYMQKLRQDKVLEEKTQRVRLEVLGIQEAVLTDKLNDFHEHFQSEHRRPSAKLWPPGRWLMVASVMVIAGIGLLLFFMPGKNEKIFKNYYAPDPGLIGTMSNENNEYLFEVAMTDYKSKKYEKALEAWLQLLAQKPQNDTLNYFIGSAYMAKGQVDKALPYLRKTISLNQSYFYADACWYYGLALIKRGKKYEAIPYIEQSNHENKEVLLEQLSGK